MTDIEFNVTNDAPTLRRSNAGRPVSNPYRQPLLDSYEQDFKGNGQWLEFTVDVEGLDDPQREVTRQVDRIRAAGQLSPKVGTEVRADSETGHVYFRGVEYSPRGRGASVTESGLEEGDLNGDDYTGPGPA